MKTTNSSRRFGRAAGILIATGVAISLTASLCSAKETRTILDLTGIWDVAEGNNDAIPDAFSRTVPVPGFVDMASPPFENAGGNTKSYTRFGDQPKTLPSADARREAFWYRKRFTIDGPVPAAARLKIGKAKFGAQAFLNGKLLGEHWPNFTPAWFDVADALKSDGQANELIIRVGASPLSVGTRSVNGQDFEKKSYLPGIYDSVEVILSGAPFIDRVQVVPIVDSGKARIIAWIKNPSKDDVKTSVQFSIAPYGTEQSAGSAKVDDLMVAAGSEQIVEKEIAIKDCRLWSPEEPNLYAATIQTAGDQSKTRFGMREFKFDEATKTPMLNGKPYYLRGTNVCFLRFEEDPDRLGKPWDEAWVRKLHRQFKSMGWNSARYCIGFPPSLWYRVADEEGLMIQDEFPIWTLGDKLEISTDTLAGEYKEWMTEHWNWPCVVIWDAQNESSQNVASQTGAALSLVRHLDKSNRPWDNGWGTAQQPGDTHEEHPYLYYNTMTKGVPEFDIYNFADPELRKAKRLRHPNPIIVNEYAWLWMKRDAEPTVLTEKGYAMFLPGAGPDERREFYARRLAALTEYWRSGRDLAGVLHFCGLGHSIPGCYTSDNFTDLDSLEFEPNFKKFVSSAFAPVGICLNFWNKSTASRATLEAPVVVINDLESPWSGNIKVYVQGQDDPLATTDIEAKADGYGLTNATLQLTAPDQSGSYELIAEIMGSNGQVVRSYRQFSVE